MPVVNMPALGESVTEGTVLRWLKEEGEAVVQDEPLLEVSTDKVDTEVVAPASGILRTILARPDDVIAVGDPLGEIGAAIVSRNEGADPESATAPAATAPTPAAPPPPAASATSTQRPFATPAARRHAHELGVALQTVDTDGAPILLRHVQAPTTAATGTPGTAPADTVTPASAERQVPAPAATGLRGTTRKASRVRRITAERTTASLRESAQLTQVFEVDMTAVAALRARAKSEFARREGIALTFLPFLAKAAVEALLQHPNLNAAIDSTNTTITYHDTVGLGIAVDTPAGLYSPVVAGADQLSLIGLAHAVSEIATAARANTLRADQLRGGTFTITNIGSNGALFDTPILVNGQSGMLGFGAITRRPMVVTDTGGRESLGIRSMCYLPLTYDHRLVDGADAGRFLTTVKQRLEAADFAAELGLQT
ncbi:2-oxoglutarate dehydrogenase, E2 component, dihydrolipoamide succinyltransferase [Nocardia sp. NPDC050378]|uniref:2-oxoglutarate dehydrogenase, E2 component, dihydrolipoamide succinyltransferase n=1 Tax=Nocardia sp. NPDC050378 TaxID=3155400 RepID=UPI0033EDFA46